MTTARAHHPILLNPTPSGEVTILDPYLTLADPKETRDRLIRDMVNDLIGPGILTSTSDGPLTEADYVVIKTFLDVLDGPPPRIAFQRVYDHHGNLIPDP